MTLQRYNFFFIYERNKTPKLLRNALRQHKKAAGLPSPAASLCLFHEVNSCGTLIIMFDVLYWFLDAKVWEFPNITKRNDNKSYAKRCAYRATNTTI
jgi:hypothetical protein